MGAFAFAHRWRASVALAVALIAAVACSDASAPRPIGDGVRVTITPLADSAYEGDVITMHASVTDRDGAVIPGATVTWTTSDASIARVSGASVTFLQPGEVRLTAQSGDASATYDLTVGRLVVRRVELSADSMTLGRGDRIQVNPRVFAQGDRELTGRAVTYASDDEQVAIIGSPENTVGNPGFLIAVGPGATSIRATVDGITGLMRIGVVVADTNFTLTRFNGAPIPALVAADTVEFDGQREFDEVYVDAGTLVLSGLLQERYALTVRVSQYHVIRTGDTVQRELRLRFNAEVDHGVVTVLGDGSLSFLSEFIGPHLEHSATITADGYLVHFHEPGDDFISDLQYRRVTP